jgi:hypothetical protein
MLLAPRALFGGAREEEGVPTNVGWRLNQPFRTMPAHPRYRILVSEPSGTELVPLE